MYFAAGAATIIALVILWGLQPLERMLFKKFKQKTLKIITTLNVNNIELLKDLLNKDELKIEAFTFEREGDEFIFN
jgi:putative Mg2+ transporter-C (MgtC) family protein